MTAAVLQAGARLAAARVSTGLEDRRRERGKGGIEGGPGAVTAAVLQAGVRRVVPAWRMEGGQALPALLPSASLALRYPLGRRVAGSGGGINRPGGLREDEGMGREGCWVERRAAVATAGMVVVGTWAVVLPSEERYGGLRVARCRGNPRGCVRRARRPGGLEATPSARWYGGGRARCLAGGTIVARWAARVRTLEAGCGRSSLGALTSRPLS